MRFAAGVVFGALLAIAVPAGATTTAVVTVDLARPGPRIEPDVHGQFIENLGSQVYGGLWVGEGSAIPNDHGVRRDVTEALRALEIPMLRWGGCFIDQYDWRDGIGPRTARPSRHVALYGGTIEPNQFGTHEFFDFAERIGAQPYLNINMGSAPPIDGARWLEYLTSAEPTTLADERRANGRVRPWAVKYVGIGNEPWGCGGLMRADHAIDVSRRYARYLSGLVHNPVKRIAGGPGINVEGWQAYLDLMMANRGEKPLGEPFFAIGLHYYAGLSMIGDGRSPPPALGFDKATWVAMLADALAIDGALDEASRIMDRHDPVGKIALSVDEWGAWHSGGPGSDDRQLRQQSSLLDAEITAVTLNSLQRHSARVKLANNSELVNALNALILTDHGRMLLTPVYHVFDLYKPFKGATPYPARVEAKSFAFGGRSVPALDVSVARAVDGRIVLALVNLDPDRGVDVVTGLTGVARGRLLSGPSLDEHNSFENSRAVVPRPLATGTPGEPLIVRLPAKSIAVLAVENER